MRCWLERFISLFNRYTHNMLRLRCSAAARVRTLAYVFVWAAFISIGFLGVNSANAQDQPQRVDVNEGVADCSDAPYKLARKHPVLQRRLLQRLRAAGFGRALARQQLAVSVVDLTDNNRVYYGGANDDNMMYAASLPKIAILLSVIEAVDQGKLEWTHEFDRRLSAMIRRSTNTDASWGASMAGLKGIEAVMRDPRYCFYDNKHGGLWVGRGFGGMSETNRDPLKNLSHATTARQTARFYTLLHFGRLVSPHWSFRMQGIMSPPQLNHKFVKALGKRSGVAFLGRKSGSWRTFHSDSALIQHGRHRYAITALADHPRGNQWMEQVAKIVDDLIVKDGRHRRRAPPAKRQAQR